MVKIITFKIYFRSILITREDYMRIYYAMIFFLNFTV